jgi:hypothetical protein
VSFRSNDFATANWQANAQLDAPITLLARSSRKSCLTSASSAAVAGAATMVGTITHGQIMSQAMADLNSSRL